MYDCWWTVGPMSSINRIGPQVESEGFHLLQTRVIREMRTGTEWYPQTMQRAVPFFPYSFIVIHTPCLSIVHDARTYHVPSIDSHEL